MSRPDENAQHQTKSPENNLSTVVEEEDAHSRNHHAAQRQHNELLRANDVIQGAHRNCGDSCDDICSDREDNHFTRCEAESSTRQDRAEGENTSEPVTEDRRSNQEEQGVRSVLSQGLHRASQLAVGIPQGFMLSVFFVNVLGLNRVEHQRQRGQQHPQRGNDHRDSNIQPILMGNSEPTDLGVNQSNEQNKKQNNSTNVTRTPSKARNTAHIVLR